MRFTLASVTGRFALWIDFESDESGNAAVPSKNGSCEMQGDGVETQMGGPNAV